MTTNFTCTGTSCLMERAFLGIQSYGGGGGGGGETIYVLMSTKVQTTKHWLPSLVSRGRRRRVQKYYWLAVKV